MMSEVTRGQTSRKLIRQEIERSLQRYLPADVSKLANLIAYDFNLSPFTVRYTYLPMFLDAGVIEHGQDGLIHLTEKGKQKQAVAQNENETTKLSGRCKNCGALVAENLDFCSKQCFEQYKGRAENETAKTP
jgi:hypothetical protein